MNPHPISQNGNLTEASTNLSRPVLLEAITRKPLTAAIVPVLSVRLIHSVCLQVYYDNLLNVNLLWRGRLQSAVFENQCVVWLFSDLEFKLNSNQALFLNGSHFGYLRGWRFCGWDYQRSRS